jgi:hypothetical protein
VQLLWKELSRDGCGYDDRIRQRQRDLRQHGVLRAVDDLRPTRHDELRQVQPEIQMREGRRDAENLPGDDADNDRHKGDGHAPVAHQQQHECRNNDAEPKLFFHQANTKSGKRQPEAELKAGRHGRGQDTRNAADQTGCTDQQEESADDNSSPGQSRPAPSVRSARQPKPLSSAARPWARRIRLLIAHRIGRRSSGFRSGPCPQP